MSRISGIAKARAIRTKEVKIRIQNAINVFKLYNKKPTVRGLAEEAGVSTATIQKYLKEMEKES